MTFPAILTVASSVSWATQAVSAQIKAVGQAMAQAQRSVAAVAGSTDAVAEQGETLRAELSVMLAAMRTA